MVLPRDLLIGRAGPRPRAVARVVLAAALCCFALSPPAAAAFQRWLTEKKLEIAGAEGTGFDQPADLALFEGRIVVLDSLNNRLCTFDARGKQLGCVAGTAEAPLTGSMGLVADSRGRFFVADGARGRILVQKDSARPALFATLDKEGKERAADPTGLLFYGDRLYVADNDNHLVRVLNAEGKAEGKWGGQGEGPGLFKYPARLAVDPRGRIGVTDVLNARIQFFTPRGEYLSGFGGPGVISGTLFRPGGFDIDGEGNVYVADAYFGTVQVFDVDGKLLAVLYDRSGSILSLRGPTALRVSRNNLFVIEMKANRVSVFTLER